MSESLRNQLAENYDKIVNSPIAPEAPEVSGKADIPGPAATPSGTTGEAPPSKIVEAKPEERARGPDGKFIEKPKEAAAPTPPAAGAPERATPALKAKSARPSSWKKDYWNHWDKLAGGQPMSAEEAVALAEYMGQRETDFQHGVATYKCEWEAARPLLEAIEPFRATLEQYRIDPKTWITNLGNAHHTLALGNPRQKLEMLARLCQDYQIPPAALFDQATQQRYLGGNGQLQPQPPPGAPALTREEAMALWEQQFAQHAMTQEIERFSAQKEKYPHYEELRETMAQTLDAGLAEDLPSAYEAALRHPRHSDIWNAIQEQDRTREAEAKAKAEETRLSKAKGKAVSVRSSTPNAPAEEKPKGLRSQLESNFDEVVGGGRV